MKKNLCFISNFYKTFFFEQISTKLESKGYSIFWICFSKKMYDYLSQTVDSNKILLLNKDLIDKKNAPIADYKLNELVNGDRFLRYQQDWSYDYLSNIQKPIYDFIKDNNLDFIFGEATHSYEILINRMVNRSKELNCRYLHPQSVRIPHRRFFFLNDEFQYEIEGSDNILNSNWQSEYKEIEAKVPGRVKQVDFSVKKELSISGHLQRAKRFFTKENIEYDHPSVISNDALRSQHAIQNEKNKFGYKYISTDNISILENKKFVFFTLHMQPEASVDVVGNYYDNQLHMIKQVWKFIPSDWYIVIKEHSNAIGNRSKDFFKDFKKHRNAILLNETESSHEVIKKAQCIFSISGTVAYEAALMGVTSFTFANIFFNRLENCHKISLEDFRNYPNMEALLEAKKDDNKNKMNVKIFSEFIYKVSFNGIVDAPINSEDWLNEENSEIVANSFEKFIKQQ
ncbi:hypothetical protein KMW28_01765 [Flammeovirga yaeyamensis]|uniref:Capsule polysaccharide biosynthesis protein n=1 Tax=Flammeovirga yaeyamensis TaxID=367791 RepID=A0AAX1N7D4_9BACT|nr:hypothetical protein [Flammeovirga yaeyamensis]MBB3699814.1 hypothetical protein [Flammeovirga yaeyamensis]NMF36617.1 hypothetical protein [Flammeovirga yaeyamensis]QWG02336.1 hypothetical protein KMW28_01765 [Flammeovirga yaeyamensis]